MLRSSEILFQQQLLEKTVSSSKHSTHDDEWWEFFL
jgi:hypothetical protein